VKKGATVFPIFFYCGNEGPVEMFYNNSGFLNNDLAAEFSALVVYMEHRYFGDSYPFGNQTEAYKKENLVYLTSLQALHDFVNFLNFLKKDVYK
jgi:Serine carboxypeptidase S28